VAAAARVASEATLAATAVRPVAAYHSPVGEVRVAPPLAAAGDLVRVLITRRVAAGDLEAAVTTARLAACMVQVAAAGQVAVAVAAAVAVAPGLTLAMQAAMEAVAAAVAAVALAAKVS